VPVNRTLDSVPPGRTVLLARIDDALAPDFREQLAAYGFVPGRALDVLAQQPMTVVVCDHVELALETAIARALVVREAGTAA
jgi:Fe2+ transport system protein FeoA